MVCRDQWRMVMLIPICLPASPETTILGVGKPRSQAVVMISRRSENPRRR